jgi:hypothetical protein
MTLDARQESELVSGGDTRLHHHLEDRVTNAQLQASERATSVSADYAIGIKDDIIIATTACSILLPPISSQREIHIIQEFYSGNLTVTTSASNTIMGAPDMLMNAYGSSAHLKGVGTDWKLL